MFILVSTNDITIAVKKIVNQVVISMKKNWYAEWFNEDYARIYHYRDAKEAATFIEELIKRLNHSINYRILDIGCGTGRHVQHLLSKYEHVIGVDLSMTLLSMRSSKSLPVLRADMRRLPFSPNSFDLILNLFTAFGYFEDDEEHYKCILNWSDLLSPEGIMIIDYLNSEKVIGEVKQGINLVSKVDAGEYQVFTTKDVIQIDNLNYINKKIKITDKGSESRLFEEKVRLFTQEEFRRMLANAGLEIVGFYGDYSFSEFTAESPRLIIKAKKNAN